MGEHFNKLAAKENSGAQAEPEPLIRPKRSAEEEHLEKVMKKPEGQ